jgi:type IV secretory pathway VirB10-like protein
MKTFASSVVLLGCLVALGGCSKSKSPDQTTSAAVTPDAATPSDLPAQVELADGGHYTGVLVSKSGSQMTFRGDNGATRTFDSRDIKSIRFGDSTNVASAPASNLAPSSAAPTEQAQSSRPRDRSSEASDTAANDTPRRRRTAAQSIVIPTGTQLQVRTNQAIDSKVASAGQTFSAEIANDVTDESGRVVIPRGSPAA